MSNFSAKGSGNFTAKKVAKPICFFCDAPAAQSVCIMGDFNGWNPTSHPLQRQTDGHWLAHIELCHGHHFYLLVVDGKPMLDPRAQGVSRNDKGERVSLIGIS